MLLDQLETEIHIWSVAPESVRDNRILENCLSMLSESELQQYGRFHSSEDSHCYLISHALVRQALSKYVDMQPSAWVFNESFKGRPEIFNFDTPPVRFNLTHTRGFAACVISLDALCGIDAERITSRHNLIAVAGRMFSAEENKEIQGLEGDAQMDYFFSRWTLREAYVKALGIGISFPTRKLTFEVSSNEDIRIAFDKDIKDYPENWRFEMFRPTDSHIVSVALGGQQQKNKKIVSRTLQFE